MALLGLISLEYKKYRIRKLKRQEHNQINMINRINTMKINYSWKLMRLIIIGNWNIMLIIVMIGMM